MSAVLGRVWSWVSPWGTKPKSDSPMMTTSEPQLKKQGTRWGLWGLTGFLWGGWRGQREHKIPEQFWEAQEDIPKPLEIEVLKAETGMTAPPPESPPRWWRRMLPSSFSVWPWPKDATGLRQRNLPDSEGKDCDLSDYGTPPPSPTPLSRTSAFRFFARSWSGEILPEHYEICFNFLRHLFDLFVVGFLCTVSPPARFVLDVLGVQGALKLWLHGMAMFFVSSVGMAGLLWLVQEYLPQFALLYGIVQALVISVSVRQRGTAGIEDEVENGNEEEVEDNEEEMEDEWQHDETSSAKK